MPAQARNFLKGIECPPAPPQERSSAIKSPRATAEITTTNPEQNPDHKTVSGQFFPDPMGGKHSLGKGLLKLFIHFNPTMNRL